MLRAILCALTLGAFLAVGVCAGDAKKTDKNDNPAGKTDKQKKKHGKRANITKVDAKKGTITVKTKDKKGKETEKTYVLTEEVRMFDSAGRASAIDVFQSGNDVLVFEVDGQLRELHDRGTKNKDNGKKKNSDN